MAPESNSNYGATPSPSETGELHSALRTLTDAVVNLQKSVDRLESRLTEDEQRFEAAMVPQESRSTARFYSFHQNFVAGSIALPLSFAVTHPLDTIKTRMQAFQGRVVGAGNQASFTSQLKAAFSTSGASKLSRGFFPSVVGASPQGGLRFGVYGIVQNKLHPYFDFPPLQNALAACAGDISSSFVKVPREVITQRLQTGLYDSTWHAIRNIMKEEGWKGFFTGYWSTCFRDIPFMVVLFVSYEQFKLNKVRITTATSRRDLAQVDREWSDGETVLWGGISGALAGFTTTPLDVIKTRIMTEMHAGENRKFKVALGNILKEDGVRGLFTGAGPRSVWWFSVCSVFFASFERIRSYVHTEFSGDVVALKASLKEEKPRLYKM